MKTLYKTASLCCEDSINQILCLESIIKTTKYACLERESSAKYYNLPPKEKYTLSEERNHYINMLTVALDKVDLIKELNISIENELNCL